MRMRRSAIALCLLALAGPLAGAKGRQARPAGGVESKLSSYLANYLPYDPATRVTVERGSERYAGFQAWKAKRTGKYPKLAQDLTVFVSEDGRWFFDGDTMANPAPRPVSSPADLAWLEQRTAALYRTRARALLVPQADVAGLKAVALAVETGYGPVRLPGYIAPDGSRYFNGTMWDMQMDPREERKRRIDLSVPRFQGKPDGAVTIVEYADMECPYCRFRGTQMDALLEANAGSLSYRRYYKFFVLWFNHAWAMKAASAGDCLFRFAGPQALFGFKKQVYAQQPAMTVSGIDELAITFAEASGVPRTDFLNCYLREESLADIRKDIEEGQRLSVRSTPTYFIDGTQITWIEDKVMEDFLRTKDPNLKSISYETK